MSSEVILCNHRQEGFNFGGGRGGFWESQKLSIVGAWEQAPGGFPPLSKTPFFREFGCGCVGVRPLPGPPPPFQFPDNQNPPASIHFPGLAKEECLIHRLFLGSKLFSPFRSGRTRKRISVPGKDISFKMLFLLCWAGNGTFLAQFGNSASFWGQILFFEIKPISLVGILLSFESGRTRKKKTDSGSERSCEWKVSCERPTGCPTPPVLEGSAAPGRTRSVAQRGTRRPAIESCPASRPRVERLAPSWPKLAPGWPRLAPTGFVTMPTSAKLVLANRNRSPTE